MSSPTGSQAGSAYTERVSPYLSSPYLPVVALTRATILDLLLCIPPSTSSSHTAPPCTLSYTYSPARLGHRGTRELPAARGSPVWRSRQAPALPQRPHPDSQRRRRRRPPRPGRQVRQLYVSKPKDENPSAVLRLTRCSRDRLPSDETVEVILANRAVDPNAPYPVLSGTTPLHLAAELGRADVGESSAIPDGCLFACC